MNKVFLSGMITGDPAFVNPQSGAAYLTFVLAVRHKNTKGMMKQELYRVNTWNSTAVWGSSHLYKNQLVALEGYLTQRSLGNTGGVAVEITAETFLPGFSVATPSQPAACTPGSPESFVSTGTGESPIACEVAASSNHNRKEAIPLEI